MMEKQNRTCVLVEDDNEHAHIFEDSMRRINLECDINFVRLSDGESATQFLIENCGEPAFSVPTVVVIDLNLPKIDGFEVLKRLSAHPLYNSVPLVVFTSSGAKQDILKAYQLGASAFMVKPLEISDFRNLVKNIVSYWMLYNHGPNIAGAPL